MNTDVYAWLYSSGARSIEWVKEQFARYERLLSRFDPASELSRLNRSGQGRFQASPLLFQAVEAALWAAEATAGIFDPTILRDLERAGYDRSFEHIARQTTAQQGLGERSQSQSPNQRPRLYSFRDVTLYPASREIKMMPSVGLDLGGMGKGWTVDRAADMLHGEGPFLINAGGDIYAYGSPQGQEGWSIELVHPLAPDRSLAAVRLDHRALATSTIARRCWRRNGRVMHHLIDPRSGQPAWTDAVSVSVVAGRTMLAEVFAKVALILGVETGLAYLERLPGVEGLIYTAEGRLVYTPGMATLLEWIDEE